MKKILLALASVLALTVFAGCQNETSGELTISNEQNSDEWSYNYYVTPSGTVTTTTTTKTVVSGGSTSESTVVTEETPCDDCGWYITWTKKRNEAYVTYKFKGNALVKTTGGDNVSYSSATQTVEVEKTDGKYYLDKNRVDLDPEASTVKINVTTTNVDTTVGTTSTAGDTTTTKTTTKVYNLTFTRR